MTEEDSITVQDLKANISILAIWMRFFIKMRGKNHPQIVWKFVTRCSMPVLGVCPDLQCAAATANLGKGKKHARSVRPRQSRHFTQAHAGCVPPCLRLTPRCSPLVLPLTLCSDKFRSRTQHTADMPDVMELLFSQLFLVE